MKNLKKLLCGALSLTMILHWPPVAVPLAETTTTQARLAETSPSSASASTDSMGPWTTAGKVSSWAWRRPD